MAKFADRFPAVALSIAQLAAVACYSGLASCVELMSSISDNYPPLSEQLSNLDVWAGILYSGILASAFAFWAQTAGQRLIEPHKIALIFALEPILPILPLILY
jgi:drug/metabolite transporter (DMT)-like permease